MLLPYKKFSYIMIYLYLGQSKVKLLVGNHSGLQDTKAILSLISDFETS